MEEPTADESRRILCRFKSENNEILGDVLDLPLDCTVEQLTLICNALLKQEENVPYAFFVDETEITENLKKSLNFDKLDTEKVVDIIYQQQVTWPLLTPTVITFKNIILL